MGIHLFCVFVNIFPYAYLFIFLYVCMFLFTRFPCAHTAMNRHVGVLGLAAFLTAFPYSAPDWMPSTLVTLAEHSSDPEPIKSSVNAALREFWRTHHDTWNDDLKGQFTEDQLGLVTDLLIGPSYYI